MFLDCWALQCWQKSAATTFIHTYKWALLYSFPFLFSINFQKWVLQWGFSEFQWGQRCGMILIWPISAGGLVTLWTLSRERREICAVRVGGCVSPKRETDELTTSGTKLTKWSPTKWLVIHSKTNMARSDTRWHSRRVGWFYSLLARVFSGVPQPRLPCSLAGGDTSDCGSEVIQPQHIPKHYQLQQYLFIFFWASWQATANSSTFEFPRSHSFKILMYSNLIHCSWRCNLKIMEQ